KGVTGDGPGHDILSGDSGAREQIAINVYKYKTYGTQPEDDVKNNPNKIFRFHQHCKVWDDYHKIFGSNTPMKRCQPAFKTWDINFEGVAHYGLMPDLLQDLSNVGLNAQDMSALFLSAEEFAQMWTRCLRAAVWA